MVATNQIIAVISDVAAQRMLREGSEGLEDHQMTHHVTQDTVDLQHHIVDR